MRLQPSVSALAYPTPGQVTDLESSIQRRLGGFVDDFQLTANDDGFVLHGRAHSYYAKQLAQHAVMQATAAPIVANDIVVI